MARGPDQSAFDHLVGVAATQLDMIEDAARRPGVDVGRLTQQSFELLVGALAATARADARHAPFVARVERWRAASVDVHHHLIELSEGWSCHVCGSDVASGAAIDGVRSGLVRVELVCKACGTRTKLGAKGDAVFKRVFGPLITPDWRPSANGFAWSER